MKTTEILPGSRPRGTCPVCGKENIRIRQDGGMFYHGFKRPRNADRYFSPGFCRGMGKPPVAGEERAS